MRQLNLQGLKFVNICKNEVLANSSEFTVFVKHYAPTICLPLKIIEASSKFHGNCPKVNQVIYTLDTICMVNIMILAQAVLHVFCSQGPLWVKCRSVMGNNSVKCSQNVLKC